MTVIPQDSEADRLRDALKRAADSADTALQAIAGRLNAMAEAGGIMAAKRDAGELQGWLALQLGADAPDPDTQKKCIALHKSLPRLNLDKRGDIVRALTLAEMLPGFDGQTGKSVRPITYRAPLYKLEQALKAELAQGVENLTGERREQMRKELEPIIKIWKELAE